MKMNNIKYVFCIYLLIVIFGGKELFGQNDSAQVKNKKQSFFMSAGVSMPLSNYASTNGDNSAYAKKGFSVTSLYNYKLASMIDLVFSHVFMINHVNEDALTTNIKNNIGAQVENEITYAAGKSTNWNCNSLMTGLGIRKDIGSNKKLSIYANVQGGICMVNSPATETIIQIDQLFYSTKIKKSNNLAPVYSGNLGLNYLFAPKTGLIFNTNFIGLNLIGNNLDVTEIGNNTYTNKTYSFEQKISSINFTIGISTHF